MIKIRTIFVQHPDHKCSDLFRGPLFPRSTLLGNFFTTAPWPSRKRKKNAQLLQRNWKRTLTVKTCHEMQTCSIELKCLGTCIVWRCGEKTAKIGETLLGLFHTKVLDRDLASRGGSWRASWAGRCALRKVPVGFLSKRHVCNKISLHKWFCSESLEIVDVPGIAWALSWAICWGHKQSNAQDAVQNLRLALSERFLGASFWLDIEQAGVRQGALRAVIMRVVKSEIVFCLSPARIPRWRACATVCRTHAMFWSFSQRVSQKANFVKWNFDGPSKQDETWFLSWRLTTDMASPTWRNWSKGRYKVWILTQNWDFDCCTVNQSWIESWLLSWSGVLMIWSPSSPSMRSSHGFEIQNFDPWVSKRSCAAVPKIPEGWLLAKGKLPSLLCSLSQVWNCGIKGLAFSKFSFASSWPFCYLRLGRFASLMSFLIVSYRFRYGKSDGDDEGAEVFDKSFVIFTAVCGVALPGATWSISVLGSGLTCDRWCVRCDAYVISHNIHFAWRIYAYHTLSMHAHPPQHTNTRFGESVQGALPFSPFAFLSHLTFLRFHVLVKGLIRVSSYILLLCDLYSQKTFFNLSKFGLLVFACDLRRGQGRGVGLWQWILAKKHVVVVVDPDAALSAAAIRCVWGCLGGGLFESVACVDYEMRRIIILTCGMMCCSRLFTPEGREPFVRVIWLSNPLHAVIWQWIYCLFNSAVDIFEASLLECLMWERSRFSWLPDDRANRRCASHDFYHASGGMIWNCNDFSFHTPVPSHIPCCEVDLLTFDFSSFRCPFRLCWCFFVVT